MEEKYVVSLYVTDQDGCRTESNVFDGIYGILEAAEVRNRLPTPDNAVIGLRLHKKGTKAATDIKIDILIGNVIHLEPLEYVALLSNIEEAVEYIAELIAVFPDAVVRGNMPDDLRNRIQKYATLHKNAEEELRDQLLERLLQLENEAMAYAGSPDPVEQKYAADLLWYAAEQNRLILEGQKYIDPDTLPTKDAYLYAPGSSVQKTEEDRTSATTKKRRYKSNSLLGKLYEYQEMIRQMKATQ